MCKELSADMQQKRQAELKEGPQGLQTAHGHPAIRDESTPSDDYLDGPVTPIGPSLVIRKHHRRSNGGNRKDNKNMMEGGFVVVDSEAIESDANTSGKGVAHTAGGKKMAIGHIITP